MRKRWTVVAAIAVSVGIAAWVAASLLRRDARPDDPPRLVVTPAEVDVQSDTGENEHVELVLSNSGKGRLAIHQVRTTCGCTVASPLERYDLAGGEQTVLRVQLQPPAYGTRETSITVTTDSAATPAVRIPVRLRGQVLSPPYIRLSPDEIRHTTFDAGKIEIPFQVTCAETRAGSPWLTAFESQSPKISVSDPVVLKTLELDDTTVAREYQFTIKVTAPEADAPPLTDMLTPRTRSESKRRVRTIPVTISRQPVLRALPSAVLVTRDQLANGPYRRRIVIVGANSDEWKISGIEPSAPWVEAKVVGGSEDAPLLEISVPQAPREQEGSTEATVQIQTTHPQCARISLSVVLN